MASLERISLQKHVITTEGYDVKRVTSSQSPTPQFPQIFWSDNSPWREANLWAYEQALNTKRSLKTILSAMTHLHAYSKWLERENMAWSYFPARESERCLVRFRGYLMQTIADGIICASTAKQRMSAVVRFYRWLVAAGLLSSDWPMWHERNIGIKLTDTFGISRTLRVASTDLVIPNRKRIGEILEYGLLPVSQKNVASLMEFSKHNASAELNLMLRLGFGTGMRFGSIADLKIQTLERATSDLRFKGYLKLSIGPNGRPPVQTKFNVSGEIWISEYDRDLVLEYVYSPRRLIRQSLADKAFKDIVFLNKLGKPYGADNSGSSRGISVELGRLRKTAVKAGLDFMRNFKFHQTRCTYATELARVALRHGNAAIAIDLVKQALLHRDEATTMRYIRFVEKTEVMGKAADDFTNNFLGLAATEKD